MIICTLWFNAVSQYSVHSKLSCMNNIIGMIIILCQWWFMSQKKTQWTRKLCSNKEKEKFSRDKHVTSSFENYNLFVNIKINAESKIKTLYKHIKLLKPWRFIHYSSVVCISAYTNTLRFKHITDLNQKLNILQEKKHVQYIFAITRIFVLNHLLYFYDWTTAKFELRIV